MEFSMEFLQEGLFGRMKGKHNKTISVINIEKKL